jgi:hypothetical protein
MEATNSWAEAYKKSWCEMIRAYIKFNLVDDVEVVDYNLIKINTKDYILEVSSEVTNLLLEKNAAYGDSALSPVGIFSI